MVIWHCEGRLGSKNAGELTFFYQHPAILEGEPAIFQMQHAADLVTQGLDFS